MKIEVTLSSEWKTSEFRHVMMALARGPTENQVMWRQPSRSLTESQEVAADEKKSRRGENPDPQEVKGVYKVA